MKTLRTIAVRAHASLHPGQHLVGSRNRRLVRREIAGAPQGCQGHRITGVAGPGGRIEAAHRRLSSSQPGTGKSTDTPKLGGVRIVTKSLTGYCSTRYAGLHSGVVRCWSTPEVA